MQTLLISAILILFLVVVFQIAKASEYVAMIRGYENARKQSNKINAFLLLAFSPSMTSNENLATCSSVMS